MTDKEFDRIMTPGLDKADSIVGKLGAIANALISISASLVIISRSKRDVRTRPSRGEAEHGGDF